MKKKESIDMKGLISAINEIEKTENIDKEYLLDALKVALEAAYKEHYEVAEEDEVTIIIDEETGKLKIFADRVVVDKVEDPSREISLEDAEQIKKKVKVGDIVKLDINPKNFGRIAAQKGKQIIVQKLREKEKDVRFEEYNAKVGEVVTGLVQKVGNVVVLDLGKLEGVMPLMEQVPTEKYFVNQKLRVYVKDVRRGIKGDVQVLVSRSSEDFVKRLFEYEIPEINEGLIEIKAVARIAGDRAKVAVYSSNENIDPVGSCVGEKGIRIQNIIDELKQEKIDVVEWSEDPARFIASALLPAEVMAVDVNEEVHFAQVIVADDQLSIAIGKEGKNVRLAASLVDFKIDIKTETQFRQIIEEMQAKQAMEQEAEEIEETVEDEE